MTALLDGELPPSRAGQVRSHVDGCQDCAAELTGLQRAADLVREHHRDLQPHPAAWNTVRLRLDSRSGPLRRGWLAPFITRWQPVTAIVLAGFGLSIGLWSYQRHIESRRELEHYMTQYIQARAAQERSLRQPTKPHDGNSMDGEMQSSENPFVLVREPIQDNPFRR
jgi:anti-sigma factor RsiW